MSTPLPTIILKAIPAKFDLIPGERCDISTITTSTPDKVGDLVLASGGDWTSFIESGSQVNYDHKSIPVGRALWIKNTTYKNVDGWIAKTQYNPPPKDWPISKRWPASVIFGMIQKGSLRGKSLTLVPSDIQEPTPIQKSQGVKRVISKWTALEYSVCATPINEEAEVLAVSKAFEDIDQIVPDTFVKDYIQILRSVDIPSLVARTLRRMQGKLD